MRLSPYFIAVCLFAVLFTASAAKPSTKVDLNAEEPDKVKENVEVKAKKVEKKGNGKGKEKELRTEKAETDKSAKTEEKNDKQSDLTEVLLEVKDLIIDVKTRVDKLEQNAADKTAAVESDQSAQSQSTNPDPMEVQQGDQPEVILDKKMQKKLKKQQEKEAKAVAKAQKDAAIAQIVQAQVQAQSGTQPSGVVGSPPQVVVKTGKPAPTQAQIDAKLDAKRAKKYPWLTLEQYKALEGEKQSKKKLEKLLKTSDPSKLRLLVKSTDAENNSADEASPTYKLVPVSPVDLITGDVSQIDLDSAYIVFTEKTGLDLSAPIQIQIQREDKNQSDQSEKSQPADSQSADANGGSEGKDLLNGVHSLVDEAVKVAEDAKQLAEEAEQQQNRGSS